ncbi:hypothetical protein ACQPZA_36840 [Pseudonocardia xinjiangensis]|uniref:hypothetical protein n=1 Tax=Pseudonocardia xinjiangensis TaxID=75289 RepID=UPI003D93C994
MPELPLPGPPPGRHPGFVPDDAPPDLPGGFDVSGGFDTDGDGRADTAVTCDGVDLVLLTDLDGDGFADQILRIGPDGAVRQTVVEPPAGAGTAITDGLRGGAEAGYEP